MPAPGTSFWQELIGHVVVLDLHAPYVYVGTLTAVEDDFLRLADVDAHDLRDTQTNREKYVLDCRRDGIHPNRARAWVSLRDVVGVSLLADVLLD